MKFVYVGLVLVVTLISISVTAGQNTFASGMSGGNPCCTQKQAAPCTPHPSCGGDAAGGGATVEAEEAPMSSNKDDECGEHKKNPCHDEENGGTGADASGHDLDKKINEDVVTPGMKRMEMQYRRQQQERQRDMKENEQKKRKLGAKLAKQEKAKVALKALQDQLEKQLSEVKSTVKVLGMQMKMTKSQLENSGFDEPKMKMPKMPIMPVLKKMHKGQLKTLTGFHSNSQAVVKKAVDTAQAGFSPGSINSKVGNQLKKQQIKSAKRLVKSMKKNLKQKL